MPYKHVLFEAAAREKVLRGANAIADAVRGTLGPRSHSVLMHDGGAWRVDCRRPDAGDLR